MKFKDYDGRRRRAIKRLEKDLAEWNSHNEDKRTKSGKIRSHEDERLRLEEVIANTKAHLK